MKLQELYTAKCILEDEKRELKSKERELDFNTKKVCLDAYPEALSINWKAVRRMLQHI